MQPFIEAFNLKMLDWLIEFDDFTQKIKVYTECTLFWVTVNIAEFLLWLGDWSEDFGITAFVLMELLNLFGMDGIRESRGNPRGKYERKKYIVLYLGTRVI